MRLRFTIARELGMSFAEVAAFDTWELAHWAALLRMEPPAVRVHQVEAAYTRAVIANAAFGSKGGHKLTDFLLEFDHPTHKPAGQPSDPWRRWAAMSGGRTGK